MWCVPGRTDPEDNRNINPVLAPDIWALTRPQEANALSTWKSWKHSWYYKSVTGDKLGRNPRPLGAASEERVTALAASPRPLTLGPLTAPPIALSCLLPPPLLHHPRPWPSSSLRRTALHQAPCPQLPRRPPPHPVTIITGATTHPLVLVSCLFICSG